MTKAEKIKIQQAILGKKLYLEIKSGKNKCACCGRKESLDNVMLKYEDGLLRCDDCGFLFDVRKAPIEDYEQAFVYLRYVMLTWKEFGKQHKRFLQALKLLTDFYEKNRKGGVSNERD